MNDCELNNMFKKQNYTTNYHNHRTSVKFFSQYNFPKTCNISIIFKRSKCDHLITVSIKINQCIIYLL